MLSSSASASCLPAVSLYNTVVSSGVANSASSTTHDTTALVATSSLSNTSAAIGSGSNSFDSTSTSTADSDVASEEPGTLDIGAAEASKSATSEASATVPVTTSATDTTPSSAANQEETSTENTFDFEIKLPDKNQLFDSLFDTVNDKKLTPVVVERPAPAPKAAPPPRSSSRATPHFNPTTVTNTRLGKDPPIPSLNFDTTSSAASATPAAAPPPGAKKTDPKIDFGGFDDMSDLSDTEEGLAAPLFENILSVLSPPDTNVPSNEDLENATSVPEDNRIPGNKENAKKTNNSFSSIFDLPDDSQRSKLRSRSPVKTVQSSPEKHTPIAPIRIPKSKLLGSDLKLPNPNNFGTPPLKLKILRTNDGSWTTSDKKKRKRREKSKKVKPFLISFLKSPELGGNSPSIIIKRACFEKENEVFPKIKLKIKKPKATPKRHSIQKLRIKPILEPERVPSKCLSEGSLPAAKSRLVSTESEEEEEDGDDDEMDEDYTPVKRAEVTKRTLVEALKISTDTADTEAIEDRIPPPKAVEEDEPIVEVVEPPPPDKAQDPPQEKFLEVVQRRLSEDSDDEDLSAVETVTKIPLSVTQPAAETEVANPPSPEVLEVEPPPKPVPEVIDLDDDTGAAAGGPAGSVPVLMPEPPSAPEAAPAADVPPAPLLAENIVTEEGDQEEEEEAVEPPSEIDLAINSIMGDGGALAAPSHRVIGDADR